MSNQNVSDDPWKTADDAKPRDFEYFGQLKLDAWNAYFPGDGQKPIPYDPGQHPSEKRVAIVEAQIIPVPELNVTFDIKSSFASFSPDWTRIALPSIKALGVDSIREINNRFVRVALVDGKREKKDKDSGEKTGEFYKTWKFEELYADEAACSAAYAGHAPATTEPVETAPLNGNGESPEKVTAAKFAQVVIQGICKGKTANDLTAVQGEVAVKFATMPMVNKYFTDQSPEVVQMIMVELSK